MKSFATIGFALLLLVAAWQLTGEVPAVAETADARMPALAISALIAPEVSATSYAVIDMETGEILAEQAGETVLPIASVTKLFTAAEVLATEPLELVVSAADVATEGRAGKLAAGDEYTTYELLYPLLLESSNDAATAIARVHGLPVFPEIVLADASGLSDGNQASAISLAENLRNLFVSEPHIFDISRLTQFVGEETGWVNNSPLKDLPGYEGGKHGFTYAANRTAAVVFSEANLGDRKLGYVVLGSDDLAADITTLRDAVTASVTLE